MGGEEEVIDERIVDIVRKVAMAVALGSDPDEIRHAVNETSEWAVIQRAALVSAGKAMGEIPSADENTEGSV